MFCIKEKVPILLRQLQQLLIFCLRASDLFQGRIQHRKWAQEPQQLALDAAQHDIIFSLAVEAVIIHFRPGFQAVPSGQ